MTGFIDLFEFTAGSPTTPRVSVVTFAGCRVGIDVDCPPEPANEGKRNSVTIIGAPGPATRPLGSALGRPPSRTSYLDCERRRVAGPPSDDAAALKAAILERPEPSELQPYTCISCGIETSYEMLSHPYYSRSEGIEGKPLFVVVTDGDQTIFGTNQAAALLHPSPSVSPHTRPGPEPT